MLAKIFPTNEHLIERVFRTSVGLVILSLIFWGPKSPWALFGLLPVFFGLSGSCPLYTVFGFSTCKMKARDAALKPAEVGANPE